MYNSYNTGILLLNTVDSLVAVSYQFTTDHSTTSGKRGSHREASAYASQAAELTPSSNHNSPTRGMDVGMQCVSQCVGCADLEGGNMVYTRHLKGQKSDY